MVVELSVHLDADVLVAVQLTLLFATGTFACVWTVPTLSVGVLLSFANTQFAARSRPASPPVPACTPWRSWLETFWFEVISPTAVPAEIERMSKTIRASTSAMPRSSRTGRVAENRRRFGILLIRFDRRLVHRTMAHRRMGTVGERGTLGIPLSASSKNRREILAKPTECSAMLKCVPLSDDTSRMGAFSRATGRAARSERGVTLVELIVTMAIMLVVLASITAAFLSGTKAEANVESRQQAQGDARLAVSQMRDDIHCALGIPNVVANAAGGYTLSLSEYYNQCAAVDNQAGGGHSQVYLAWCTIPNAATPGTFDLYRENGTCDATGKLIVGGIVAPAAGWPAGQSGNLWPAPRPCKTGYLETQRVDLAVNPDTVGSPNEAYELKNEIALRNATRSFNCTGSGSLAQLVFTIQPANASRNLAFASQPVVAAEDSGGNIVTSYTGTVTLAIKAGTGTSGATLSSCTGTPANGVTTFSGCKIDTTGTGYVLTASDGTFSKNSASFGVTSAPVTSLAVTGYASPTAAGASHTFTVSAKDSGGVTVTGYTGTVQFASSDPAAALPASYTFVAGDNGTHTFTATLKTVGSRSITATDSAITGSQTGITVTAGPAATLVVSGYPSPTAAGASHSFTVTAKDSGGNTVTGYTGTVHFTSSDGAATLPANYTFVAGDSGSHTFNATLKTAGTQSITATDTVTGTITGSQTGITVSAGSATTLLVSGYPSPTSPNVSHTFTVTAKDAGGNVATGYTGTVHFTSSDGAATLPANYTFVAADNGTHTFNATLKTVGTRTITATDTVTATITGVQTGIVVNVATAMKLVNCAVNGSSVSCTSPFSLGGSGGTLTANIGFFDASGNPAAATATVNLTSGTPANATVAPASVSAADATQTGQFTVTKQANGNKSATITAQAAGFTNLTFTVGQ